MDAARATQFAISIAAFLSTLYLFASKATAKYALNIGRSKRKSFLLTAK